MSWLVLKKKMRQLIIMMRSSLIGFFYSRPDAVISYGNSIGDDLLCKIIARQLKEKGYRRIWIKTYYPDIFLYNKDISKVLVVNKSGLNSKEFEKILKEKTIQIIKPHYTFYNPDTDRDNIPQKHIVHIMCDKANVVYPEKVRPYFFLLESEKLKGKVFTKQVCIQSTGKSSKNFMANKEWYPARLQKVLPYLTSKYSVIQVGSKEDDLLEGVVDMRGKTSIRETAALLCNSLFFVGLVGFLMHLARSVECRSVIIYGGRESPDQTGYTENINLYSAVDCAPCWYWSKCDFNKKCMDIITEEHLEAAIKKMEILLTFPVF